MRYVCGINGWELVNKSDPDWIYGLTKKEYTKYYLLEKD
jgi:hypothetical protein